jgi:hypothetical protein
MGIEEVLTAYRSPWQNAYVERLNGSIRRECIDHIIVWNERHLKRILRGYFEYHNNDRTHLGLAKEPPVERPISKKTLVTAQLLEMPRVGGFTIDMNGVKLLEFSPDHYLRETGNKTRKKPEESAKRDELVAPLTWAQRLKRVFDGAAFGLILPCAQYAAAPCGSSPTSLTQMSSRKSWITSKRNHHQSNPRQLFNPKTCLDEQAKITSARPLNLLSDHPGRL